MDNNDNIDSLKLDSIVTGDVLSIDSYGRFKARIGEIHRGGMGIVFQMFPFDDRFSVKALKTHNADANLNIFLKEANNWFDLGNHINIAEPLWFGKWSKRCCIIMDWYPKTLANLSSAKCSIDDIFKIVIGIVAGLDFASNKTNLIHQDIKPSNILIDKLGNPKLADFGLAILGRQITCMQFNISDRLEMKQTISFGDIGGTVYYMAPEILAKGARPSYKTDMYSLGVTLYEWLTAQHPYAGPETNYQFYPELRENVLDGIFKEHGAASIPIIDTIRTCLSLNSSERPSSYSELLVGLGQQKVHPKCPLAKTPHEIFVQVSLYREIHDYGKAEKLLKEAQDYYQNDPFVFNTYARFRIYQNRITEAIELFKRGAEILKETKGIYDNKPYLDPIMNLARAYIITDHNDAAMELLQQCWDWSGEGKNEDYIQYEEMAWFLLCSHNPHNAADILLHLSKIKKLDNIALRWFTLALFLSEVLGVFGSAVGPLWLETDFGLEEMDAIAMCLCAIKTRDIQTTNETIWNLIDTKFPNFAEVGLEYWGRPDWYKTDHPDLGLYLAAILDLYTTGGAYAEKYKPYLSGKKLYSDLG